MAAFDSRKVVLSTLRSVSNVEGTPEDVAAACIATLALAQIERRNAPDQVNDLLIRNRLPGRPPGSDLDALDAHDGLDLLPLRRRQGGLVVGRQTALGGLPVPRAHVLAGLLHDPQHVVVAHHGPPIGRRRPQHQRDRVERLGGAHGVALDARNLHEAKYWIASHAQTVLQRDLSSLVDLLRRAAQGRAEACSGHGRGSAHLGLAAADGAADGCPLLGEDPGGGCREEEGGGRGALVRGLFLPEMPHVVRQHSRHDACGAVRGCGDDLAHASILLHDREGIDTEPAHLVHQPKHEAL
mmetsp:Transcript_100190/g.321292  ORF Transcript_100190/g.321292 Transcript_100190/m.321292 type:complete len:297 (+) Transcript_100190:255-1145(+)